MEDKFKLRRKVVDSGTHKMRPGSHKGGCQEGPGWCYKTEPGYQCLPPCYLDHEAVGIFEHFNSGHSGHSQGDISSCKVLQTITGTSNVVSILAARRCSMVCHS